MKWYHTVISSFAGTALALVSAAAFLWFRWIKPIVDWVYLWWNHPLDTDMPPFPTATALDPSYTQLWQPWAWAIVGVAAVALIELGLIAWALWRKR